MTVLATLAVLTTLQVPGLITGSVTDGSGGVVSGAAISLHNTQRALVAVTTSNRSGDFEFAAVAPGRYVVTSDALGFSPQHSIVEVQPDRASHVAVTLSVPVLREELTITADIGQIQVTTEATQALNVVAEAEIENRAVSVLAEVVKEEAGLAVQRTSSAIGAVVVRGLTEVTVFVDGVRFTNSAQRGGINTFFNLTEPGSLSGVEVLRGTNSAQYGSDSLGGTVQLISKPPTFGPGSRPVSGEWTAAGSTSNRSVSSRGLVNLAARQFGILINVNGRRVNTLRPGGGVDSHSALTRFLGISSSTISSRLTDTAFTQYGGDLRLQWSGPDGRGLVLHYQRGHQDGSKRYDQLLGGDGNLVADVRNLMADFGYVRYLQTGSGLFHQSSVTFSLSSQREERVNQGGQGNAAAAITHEKERTTTLGLNAWVDRQIGPATILVGADLYRDRVHAPAFTLDPSTRIAVPSRPRIPHGSRYLLGGIFLQKTLNAAGNRIRTSGALRYNIASYRSRSSNAPLLNGRPLFPDDSLRVSDVSGRAGVTAHPTPWWTLSAAYSRGFRAPNITALGSVGLVGVGYQVAAADLAGRNATVGSTGDETAQPTGRRVGRLQSETTHSGDLSIHLHTGRMRTGLTGFQIDINDVITRQTLLLPAGAAGSLLGSDSIERQLPSGAVFVALSTNPVLAQVNFGRTRLRGLEFEADAAVRSDLTLTGRFSLVRAHDRETGLAPNLGGAGLPPANGFLSVRYAFGRRYWVEAYSTLTARQRRLSSLDLADRRTGASRSRANIASFFNRGARVRGLIGNGPDSTPGTADDRLLATGETLSQVQQRILGNATSAPLFSAIPGYGLIGLRGHFRIDERSSLSFDIENIADKSHRAPGWGIDGAGRGLTLRYKLEF